MKSFGCILNGVVFFATALVISGCGTGGTSYSLLGTGESFTQSNSAFNNQIDILWVVDNSGSMGPLQSSLTSNFTSFINTFQTKGYDFKMAVTTSDAYLADSKLNGYVASNAGLAKFRDGINPYSGTFVIIPTTPNLTNTFVTNATTGSNGSGDERVFSSFRTAMNYSASPNTGFLRTSSYFAVIILSDEDDFSGSGRCEGCGTDHNYGASTLDTVGSYETYLDTLTQSTLPTRRYNVSAIAVLDNTCLAQHQPQSPSSIIGKRMIQIANDTSGVTGSICSPFATTLDSIQSNIATLSTQFFLNKTPQVNTIVVTVNGAFVAENATNGWQYSSAANSILFYGTAIPAQGAQIGVNFIPQTIQ